MKAHVQTICLLSFAAFSMVSCQLGPAALPECAKPCAATLPAECKSTDYKCICGSSDWITNISCCVKTACSAADQQKTIEVATSLCSIVGVTLPSIATCPSSTAAPASTSSTTPESTSSSGSATSATLKQSSTASSGSATSAASKASSSGSATSAASKQSSSSGATAGAATSSSTSPVSTGAAGHHAGQGFGAAGAAALALAFI